MHVNNSVTVKTVGGISLCNEVKLEESEGYNYFFCCFLYVRIEIDQLFCVICCQSNKSQVNCKQINHSRSALVISSTLQLTSKQ